MSLRIQPRHYALIILTLTYVFNFVDRQLLAILVEPIKAEFGISDTKMGLLYGLAFAIFYTSLALPVARLADRANRRNIVAGAAALWSLFTVLCAFATNFWTLFAYRTGVAVGEAGGVPPSQSMITDYYPPHQRARAMAVFSSATFIGTLVAFVGGAYIADNYGWRMAFMVVGAPGILLALLLRFTTTEPQRGKWEKAAISTAPQQSLFATLNEMWSITSMRYLLVGCGAASMAGYALGYWAPSFMIRVHDQSIQQAGNLIGVTGITFGLFGSLIGAVICDRLAKTNRSWMLFMPALSLALSLPLMWLFLYWPESEVTMIGGTAIPEAIWIYCLAALFGSWWAVPTYVAVQEVVAPGQRTVACAVLLFVMNLVGFGLGPALVGVISDFLTPQYGDLAIRYALIYTMSAYLLAMVCYFLAGRSHQTYEQRMADTRLPDKAPIATN